MSENTKIEWADHSWSPWRGCAKVSPGCANCYAETLSKRNPVVLGEWGKGKPRVLAKNWNDPLKWNRREGSKLVGHAEFASPTRPRVFPSLCDWLDDEVPVEWLALFLGLIHETPHLDWLLLTKRPEAWAHRMQQVIAGQASLTYAAFAIAWLNGTPPPNVWIGVSVEDQERADERVPLLLDIPARIRWLSVEPLLSYVDLTHIDAEGAGHDKFSQINALTGRHTDMGRPCPSVPHVDWVVIGGESGDGARPCDVEWIRSITFQARNAKVPVFVKQLGGMPVDRNDRGFEGDSGVRGWPMGTDVVDDVEPGVYQGKPVRVRLRHRKGGDPSEWPEVLRVREFPKQKGQS